MTDMRLVVLNALLDVYAVGNVNAPFTHVNKAMLDAGVERAILLQQLKLKDVLVTPENLVIPSILASPIYVDIWITDNRLVSGRIRAGNHLIILDSLDLWDFDSYDCVTDPTPFASSIRVEPVVLPTVATETKPL